MNTKKTRTSTRRTSETRKNGRAPQRTKSAKGSRTCLLVLGMHRSGTSALTRALNFLGAELPKNMLGANPSNEKGHWEPIKLVALHDWFLSGLGSRWDDWRRLDLSNAPTELMSRYSADLAALLEKEFGSADLIVLKEPRICRFADWFLNNLERRGYKVFVVLPFRNPLEVSASLIRRDGMLRSHAALLWLRHILDAEFASRGVPRRFIDFEHLLSNPQRALGAIGKDFGLIEDDIDCRAKSEINAFIKLDKQHHSYSLNELQRDSIYSYWQSGIYEACLALQNNATDSDAMKIFDNVRAQFDGAEPLLSTLALDSVFAVRERIEKIHQSMRISDTSTDIMRNKNSCNSQNRSEFGNIEEINANVNFVDNTLSEIVNKTIKNKNRIEELSQTITRKETALLNSEKESVEYRSKIAELSQSVNHQGIALSNSQNEVAESGRKIEDLSKTVRQLKRKSNKLIREYNELRYRSAAIEKQALRIASLFSGSRSKFLPFLVGSLMKHIGYKMPVAAHTPREILGKINDTTCLTMKGPEFRTPPLVSVIVPVKNGLPQFEHVINMLSRQKLDAGFEVIVIDSGSTDGSVECVPDYDPRFRLIEIEPSDFGHGKTRNLGVDLARGDYCAFLTHDALPADEYWLSALVAPLRADRMVAGVFGRHVAYPNASPFTSRELKTHFEGLRKWPIVELSDAREYARNLGLRQVYHFYSDNSSCLRKSVWFRHRYPDVDFAEDQLWAKQIIEAGYKKAFAWDSVVYHSHDYSPWQRLKRSYDEARALRDLFGYEMCSSTRQALVQALRTSVRDLVLAISNGWIITNPVMTLAKPLDNVARQTGYRLGAGKWGKSDLSIRLLSRDKALQAG